MLKPSQSWLSLGGYPALTAGSSWMRGHVVSSARGIKDLNEDASRVVIDTLLVEENGIRRLTGSFTGDAIKPVAMDISPLGTYTLMLRNGKEDKPYIDLNGGQQISRIDTSDVHGKCLGDGWFSGISWSQDEEFVAYVAQRKPVVKKTSSLLATEGGDEETRGSKFAFQDDWGEKYEGLGATCISILNVKTGIVVSVVDGGDEMTVGQPVLRRSDDGKLTLFYTGWSVKPKRLGMIYCYNRPCAIYSLDVTDATSARSDGEKILPRKLTAEFALARSPRVSPNGETLVFIGRQTPLTTHNGCFQILAMKLGEEPEEARVCIDLVSIPKATQAFPGVFADQLPRQCFLTDTTIVFNSMWGSRDSIVMLDITSGSGGDTPKRLNPLLGVTGAAGALAVGWNDLSDVSCTVQDVNQGRLLFSTSSPNCPPRLGLYNPSTGQVFHDPVQPPLATTLMRSGLGPLESASQSATMLSNMRWKILAHRDDETGASFESILLLPSPSPEGSKKLPIIVVPHGGPHSCTPTSFLASYAYLATECKCAVLNVNYRGSTGFGEASINSLPGNIGRSDVKDMITAIDDAVAAYTFLDKETMAVVGGSHGGFLAAHLVGQHPTLFKAAAMRNPVINIPAMFGTTDIPDWTMVESGVPYDFSKFSITSAETLAKMLACSPAAYVDQVRTPTLLCIGSKDRRVPASQGIEYYHMLQARGVPSKLLIFPDDNHALDKPCTEAEHFIAIAQWITQHFKSEKV